MEVEIPTTSQHGAPPPQQQQPPSKKKLARSWRLLPSAAAKKFRDPLLVVNFALMAVGTACGPLLLRAYFLRGGTRKWLSSLLQTAGWPLLLVPLCASYLSRRRRRRRSQDDGGGGGGGGGGTRAGFFLMAPRLLAASVVIGLMTGVDNFLYAYGQASLPVSTSSIVISTQLAFTAGFAFLLVRQRFTASAVNAVVLLTVGAAMLGMNGGGDRPAGTSPAQYRAGFGMTLAAAALYGLILPVMEFCQAQHAGAVPVTYTLVIEMQVVIGLTATTFCAVGMLVNKDFHAIPREAREFGLGQTGYYLLLVGTATVFQCFCLGSIGAVFYGSALLAMVITTVLIPVTEVLAVVFFHEPFSSSKGVALALSLWGFASYFYGEMTTTKAHQSDKAPEKEHQPSLCVLRDCEK